MALGANTVIEVRVGGNDTNGGGWVSGSSGLDYSQKDAKNDAGFSSSDKSATDAVANASTTITSATANFSTFIVGNIVYMQGGTNSLAAGWYHVTARASTTSITVDRTVAAGTGITLNIGGGLASLGMASGVGLVAGATVYIQQGTYTISSATASVSGGCFSSSLSPLTVRGFGSAHGDLATGPLLQASGISTFTLITMSGARSMLLNVGMDCAGLTSSRGALIRNICWKCYCLSPTNSGFIRSTGVLLIRSYVTGHTTQAAIGGSCMDCYAGQGTTTGFALNSTEAAIRCISDANTGGSSSGFTCAGANSLIHCTAYGNGNVGYLSSGAGIVYLNCIAESNAGAGFNINSQLDNLVLNYGLISDVLSGSAGKGVFLDGAVVGSGSFFASASGHNFALNEIRGAGHDLWSAGSYGALTANGTGYLDIGALQHRELTRGYAG